MSISHISLFKRSNRIWYILYTQNGRTRWKSTGETLKSLAIKRVTDFDKILRSKPKPKTLSVFAADFLAYAETIYSESTVDIYRRGLGHLRAFTGDCVLCELSPKDIDRYKSKRVSAVSPVSVNIEVRGLRAIMNVALRWGVVDKNPFERVRMLSIPHQPPVFLSKEDFEKLTFAIRESWLRNLVLIAVLTGMRRGELCNLKWAEVDFQRRVIHIQSSDRFKTKQGRFRTIPLNDLAFHLFEVLYCKSVGEYVFTSRDNQVTEDWITHAFKKYIRAAGLNPKLHFHSLRHTFASWLVQDGVSLYEVQKLLGHSSSAVTQGYSHLLPEKLHSTVNRISLRLN